MDVAGTTVVNVDLDVEGVRRVTESRSGSGKGVQPKNGLSVGSEPETGKSTLTRESRSASLFDAINPTDEFPKTRLGCGISTSICNHRNSVNWLESMER